MDVAVVEMVVIVGILDVTMAAITAAVAAAIIAVVVTSPSGMGFGMGFEMASVVDIMRDGKMP